MNENNRFAESTEGLEDQSSTEESGSESSDSSESQTESAEPVRRSVRFPQPTYGRIEKVQEQYGMSSKNDVIVMLLNRQLDEMGIERSE